MMKDPSCEQRYRSQVQMTEAVDAKYASRRPVDEGRRLELGGGALASSCESLTKKTVSSTARHLVDAPSMGHCRLGLQFS